MDVVGVASSLVSALIVGLIMYAIGSRPWATARAAARRLHKNRSRPDVEVPVVVCERADASMAGKGTEVVWKQKLKIDLRDGRALVADDWPAKAGFSEDELLMALSVAEVPVDRGMTSVAFGAEVAAVATIQRDDLVLVQVVTRSRGSR